MTSKPTVAVIGSFKTRENYRAVLSSIAAFRNEGWTVISPSGSPVIEPDIDFVRFETDDASLSDAEVQTRTLGRIMAADLTYVAAPNVTLAEQPVMRSGGLCRPDAPYFSRSGQRTYPSPSMRLS